MVWTAVALLTTLVIASLAMKHDREGRLSAWRSALTLTAAGFTSVVVGSLTGNLAIFYGGALFAVVGFSVTVVLSLVIYRDRSHPGGEGPLDSGRGW